MTLPRRALLAAALVAATVAGLAYHLDARRVPVVVAARAIASESLVASEDVAVVELPPGAVPDDVLSEASRAVGRVARAPLARGQLVLASVFDGPPGFRSGMRPPPGWLAVALPVSPATALGGAVAPGMRIDVVAVPVPGRAPAGRAPERVGAGLLVLDVRSDWGGPFAEPVAQRGASVTNARLGTLVVAIPREDDLRFADRIATSTFVVFRAP